MLHILARELITGNGTATDVQIKKSVGVVSIVSWPVHRRTLAEAADAVA